MSGVGDLSVTDITVDVTNTSNVTWIPGEDDLNDFVIDMSLRTENPVGVDNLSTLHELNMKEMEEVYVAEEEKQPHEQETNRCILNSVDDTRNLTAGIAYDMSVTYSSKLQQSFCKYK
ncbi:uncharacterized protein LOC117100703 [Anneissia japonica]|uniref:uncharacterized protein LOC117100703 n=1 Tax=Anneissia japonica TaxID=1529436 RepID=UPI0014256773|nr:uncharacterized protein LOC117100703 [Anneissia japonica]